MMDKTETNLEKYKNKNPIQRMLLHRFFNDVNSVLEKIDYSSILEFGCGEGYFLLEMRRRSNRFRPDSFFGVDIRKEALSWASALNPGFRFKAQDILIDPLDWNPDLVIASEVLEHLAQPEIYLSRLLETGGKYFLLTVPWEPWFRVMNFLRGRHIFRLGNHPEHINTWTFKAFLSFVEDYLKVICASKSFPFTIVLAQQLRNVPSNNA